MFLLLAENRDGVVELVWIRSSMVIGKSWGSELRLAASIFNLGSF